MEKLRGDHDVFGDGSVVIRSAPGHGPGHQALFLRLAESGNILLTAADAVLWIQHDPVQNDTIRHAPVYYQ